MSALLNENDIPGFLTELDTVYAADFFDGEGHINCRKNKGPNGKIYLALHISIGQSQREVLEWFAAIFGGNIYEYKAEGKKTKVFWQWSIVGTRARKFARQIRPYCKVKMLQIDTAVNAWENREPL